MGLAFDPYNPSSIAAQMNRLAEDSSLAANCRAAIPGVLAAIDAATEWDRLAEIYERLRYDHWGKGSQSLSNSNARPKA